MADKLADWEQCKNNVIIYNLVENLDRKADKKAFTNLCQVVFSERFAITKVFRLGKHNENRDQPRPLRVALCENLIKIHYLQSHLSYVRRPKGENNLIIQNNSIIVRPTRPQFSVGRSTAPGSQPMAPVNNQAK